MDIYVDVLLVENILMNYIILWLTSITVKVRAGRIKMFAASVVGAMYALLIFPRVQGPVHNHNEGAAVFPDNNNRFHPARFREF